MKQILFESTISNDNSKLEQVSVQKKIVKTFLPTIFLVFIFSIVISVCQNFFFSDSRILVSTDGKHYLHTINLLVEFILSTLSNNSLTTEVIQKNNLSGHLLLDGPTLSVFFVPLLVLSSKIASAQDWGLLTFVLSLIHGLTASLLSIATFRITKKPAFAFIGGLIYSFYPSAVLQTGHLMSETAVSLLILVAWLGTATQKNTFAIISAGIASGLIICGKPALIPAIILLLILGIFHTKSKEVILKTIAFYLMGLFISLGPWLYFCYQSTGTFSPTAQRQPLYNVATGWNLEANGWAHNPHPVLTDLFSEQEGPLASAIGVWIAHPQESLALAFAKITRLFSLPWNDFKGRVYGLDMNAQILIHHLIILFGLFGICLYFLYGRKERIFEQNKLLLDSAAMLIFAHLAYLMVEALPRYAFTSMPFFCLFSIVGIWQLLNMPLSDKSRAKKIFYTIFSTFLLATIILHAEATIAYFNPHNLKERSIELDRNCIVEKHIDLSTVKTPALKSFVLLLVDADKEIENSYIEINGKVIEEKLQPFLQFDWQHYLIYDQWREFASSMRVSVDDFRQWRFLVIPKDIINFKGTNSIKIFVQNKRATIYSDKNKNSRYVLSPDYCNYGLLAASALSSGVESRMIDPYISAKSEQRSFIHRTKDKKEELNQALRIRLMLCSPFGNSTSIDKNSKNDTYSPNIIDKNKLTINIEPKHFNPILWDQNNPNNIRINKFVLKAAPDTAAQINLSTLDSQFISDNSTHLRIKLSAEIRSEKEPGEASLLCSLNNKNKVQILGKTPNALKIRSTWQKYEIDDLVPLSLLDNSLKQLQIVVYPCPWIEAQYGTSKHISSAIFRNIKIEIAKETLPSSSGMRRFIY